METANLFVYAGTAIEKLRDDVVESLF